MKQTLKKLVCWGLQQDLPVRIKLIALSGAKALTILNLHRITAKPETYASISASLFDDLLPWLKQNFSLVGFDDLARPTVSDKPFMIISFDDGYKDFIDIAVPLLEKHRVRVNQNVIPAAIESGLPPMNVILQDFITAAPAALLREVPLPGLPNGADPNARANSCLRCSSVFKAQPIAEQKAQFTILKRQIERFDEFQPSPVMTIDEVRQISRSHDVGAHSFEHASMAAESDAYLRHDARKCRDYFLERLGFAPSIYAFPNSSGRAGQPDIVHEEGFAQVLLGEGRYSQLDAWRHYRFSFYATSREEARARALGWPSFFGR